MVESREMPAEQVFGLALRSELNGDTARSATLYDILDKQGAFAQAAANYSILLAEAGRFSEAAGVLEGALQRTPNDAVLVHHFSQALLRLGHFDRGWRLHEQREIHINRRVIGKPRLSFPEWDGGSVGSL